MSALPVERVKTTFRDPSLSPAIGTTIKGEGRVVLHDVTRCDLRRMCVETMGRYPDVEIWTALLKGKDIRGTWYAEKIVAGAFFGYLWFFWKEA